MLTFVRNDTNHLSIYANAKLQVAGTNFGNPVSSTNTLKIGKYNANPSLAIVSVLDGDIGVVRIYNTNLTFDQIVQLYTNGLTGLIR
jgi:hypothetical protein